MKRGAERQLTKDEYEDGVEPEARLADPDDTLRFTHLPQHYIVNVGHRFQKSCRRNFENQNVRNYSLQ